MKLFLEGNYCRVDKADLNAADFAAIERDLTVTYTDFVGNTVTQQLLVDRGDNIYMPRVYALHRFDTKCIGRLIRGNDIVIDEVGFRLLDWQRRTCREFLFNRFHEDDIARERAGGIISLPTGVGKTFILAAFVKYFHKKAIWFTITDPVVRQTVDVLNKAYPKLRVRTPNDADWREADIVVTTVHKFVLPHCDFTRHPGEYVDWVKTIGLAIYDEIHALGGQVFKRVFERFPVRYQVGASATPERDSDSMDLAYKYMVGDVFIDPLVSPPRFPGHVEAIYYINQSDNSYRQWQTFDNGNLQVAKTTCMIALDPARREILYRILPEALERGSVMIYCGFHNVVNILERHLSDRFDNVYSVTGQTPMRKELDALENADILLGTSKIFTGLSKERFMSLVLFATIKKQTKQAIGRIKRWCDHDPAKNDVERVVYDIVDVGSLSAIQFRFRRTVYSEEGWSIIASNHAVD